MAALPDLYKWEDIAPFKPEEVISLNRSFESVRIVYGDPVRQSPSINFYENIGFYLYELGVSPTQKFPLRTFPLRILYNRITGQVFDLKGNNRAIYQLNNEAKPFEIPPSFSHQEKQDFIKRCQLYIRFFFDNVEGRHGRFYLFENFDGIKQGIKYFYAKNVEAQQYTKNQYEDSQRLILLKELMQESLVAPAEEGLFMMTPTSDPFDGSNSNHLVAYHTFMVFKGHIFYGKINIGKSSDSENGIVSIENEIALLPSSEENQNKSDYINQIMPQLDSWQNRYKNLRFEEYLPSLELFDQLTTPY